MANYTVTWAIDVIADSAEDAAREALEIQRDCFSEATYFNVVEDSSGKTTEVEL